MTHWIIAPVLLPCMAGALLLFLRGNLQAQRLLSVAATLALALIAAALLVAATASGPELYRLGDWPAPFGIVLMLDRLSALMLGLTAALAVPVLLYVIATEWDARGRHFHALFQFQLMGICGAFLTADAFNLFVFFEVLLIASYGLMIHAGGRDRLRAGVQYIAFNLVGSTLFLFALATLYAVTGTLNMADLAVKVAALPEGDVALLRVGAVLLILVFAIKGALVPLQFWLPGTYANAPGPVAALFAIMTKVGAYAIIRFGTLVFPPGDGPAGTLVPDLLMPAALLTLAVGAIGTLGARDVARQAGFAAIASMGTLFVAIAAFDQPATGAALYYLIHSTFAGAAMFLIADAILRRRGTGDITAPRPVFAGQAVLAALFMVAAIAMAGMPPLSGFLGKLLVMQAVDGWVVWSVILAGSFLMILGFARAGSTLFWKSHATEGSPAAPALHEPLAIAALALPVAAMVALTVFAGPVSGWLDATAASLHDPAAYIAANDLPHLPERAE
jgi:multicomponent K+:H+ antiporter subunit D